jgi:hypothetical protein
LQASYKLASPAAPSGLRSHTTFAKKLESEPEYSPAEFDEHLIVNWDFCVEQMMSLPILQEYDAYDFGQLRVLLDRFRHILNRPISALLSDFFTSPVIEKVVQLALGTIEPGIIRPCLKIVSDYAFRFGSAAPFCDASFVMKLVAAMESFERKTKRAGAFAFINLSTEPDFFKLLPMEAAFWRSIFEALEDDTALTIWMLSIFSRYEPTDETIVFSALERCLSEIISSRYDTPRMVECLNAISALVSPMNCDQLLSVQRLFVDEPLKIIATFVNDHVLSALAFNIFQQLARINVGVDIILDDYPLRAMESVLNGIPDEVLRVSVLDFLAFCVRSDRTADDDDEVLGPAQTFERFIESALTIAHDGNFAEKRAAVQFLCAAAHSRPDGHALKERLYPVLGDIITSRDRDALADVLATVRDLMVEDPKFVEYMLDDDDYRETVLDIAQDPDVHEDDVVSDVLQSINLIMTQAWQGRGVDE